MAHFLGQKIEFIEFIEFIYLTWYARCIIKTRLMRGKMARKTSK